MKFERKYYLDELIARKHNGMVKIITGLRRGGKSYLLFELFRAHLIESGVSEDQIIVVQNNVLPWHNDNGTLILSLKQFLLEEDSWEKWCMVYGVWCMV